MRAIGRFIGSCGPYGSQNASNGGGFRQWRDNAGFLRLGCVSHGGMVGRCASAADFCDRADNAERRDNATLLRLSYAFLHRGDGAPVAPVVLRPGCPIRQPGGPGSSLRAALGVRWRVGWGVR